MADAEPGPDAGGEAGARDASRPKFRGFRPKGPRLDADQAARQGKVTASAWAAFQDRSQFLAFLNQHHDELGGRPIDLAVASPEGLAAVELVIAASAPGGIGSGNAASIRRPMSAAD